MWWFLYLKQHSDARGLKREAYRRIRNNDRFHTKTDGFHTKTDGFYTKTDGFYT